MTSGDDDGGASGEGCAVAVPRDGRYYRLVANVIASVAMSTPVIALDLFTRIVHR